MDFCWVPQKWNSVKNQSGQIIATSHDLIPNGVLVREIPLFQGNLGWWNIIIWPDQSFPVCFWEVCVPRADTRFWLRNTWVFFGHQKHVIHSDLEAISKSLHLYFAVSVWGLEQELTRLRTMAIATPTEGLNGVLAATGARTAEHMKELLKKDVNRNECSSKTIGYCLGCPLPQVTVANEGLVRDPY